MTKFDSSRAWREANRAVAANRDVLLVLAGVFFMLPWLAFMLLVPEPNIDPSATPADAVKAMAAFLREHGIWLLALSLAQSAGALTVMALCADPARLTVAESIRRGLVSVVPYFAALCLFALGFVFAAGLLGTVATVGGKGGEMLVGLALNLVLIYAMVRLVMVGPVVAVERTFQPWRVLIRAWRLTRANFGRIFLFLLLLVIASQVAMAVVSMVVGGGIGLVAGPEAGRLAETVATAAMIAAFLLYLTSVLAAIHAQLAGPWSSTTH